MSELTTKCESCHGLIDEEDLFCSNCGTEAPQRQSLRKDDSQTATHCFECSGCGASMSYDAKAGSLRCPFCGSDNLKKKEDHKTISPSRVIPFVISQQQAVDSMREWLGKGFWRPGDLSSKAMVVDMTAVYVPYWVFQAKTYTYWTADTNRTPASARGDWYPITGKHHGVYRGLLIGASGALSPRETSQICPFDLATGVAADEIELENVTVEQFAVARKYARPLARGGIESLEARACDDQYVPGKSRNVNVNTLIQEMSSEPILLPVWIMAYRYQEKVFRFLVNGQTGKSSGEAPISYKKIGAAIALAVIAILLVLIIIAAASGSSNNRECSFPDSHQQKMDSFPSDDFFENEIPWQLDLIKVDGDSESRRRSDLYNSLNGSHIPASRTKTPRASTFRPFCGIVLASKQTEILIPPSPTSKALHLKLKHGTRTDITKDRHRG